MSAHHEHRKSAVAYRINTWPRRYWQAFVRITSVEPYPVDIIGGCKQVIHGIEPVIVDSIKGKDGTIRI